MKVTESFYLAVMRPHLEGVLCPAQRRHGHSRKSPAKVHKDDGWTEASLV